MLDRVHKCYTHVPQAPTYEGSNNFLNPLISLLLRTLFMFLPITSKFWCITDLVAVMKARILLLIKTTFNHCKYIGTSWLALMISCGDVSQQEDIPPM